VAGETYYYAVAAETAAGEGARCPAVSAVAIDVPGAPGDLVADPGDGQVVLTWTAPFDGGSAMTGYVVVRTSGGDTEEFETGVVTTYTDTEVTNGETYSYQVLATNELGRGASSTSVEASPFKPVFVPGKVSSLAATAKRSRVTLTWMAPDDDGGSPLTGYVILRGESADSMTEIALVGLSTSYLDEDVKEGTTYHYTVLAVNAVGQGDPVDSVQVKVPKAEVDEDEFPTLLMVGIVVVLAAIVLGRVVMPRLKKQV
jgi:titin